MHEICAQANASETINLFDFLRYKLRYKPNHAL